MILHVKGKVDYIDSDGTPFISIANGFSFQVDYIASITLGDDVDMWLYMIMKEVEGKMDLKFYGFNNRLMIEDFEKVMSISGVGPKMAFSLLKNISKNELLEIVHNGDFAKIKKLPGIGDKLAKRIVLELSRVYGKDDDILIKMQKGSLSNEQTEVLATLVQMGFDKNVIIDGMKNIDPSIPKKDMLKEVLMNITTNAK